MQTKSKRVDKVIHKHKHKHKHKPSSFCHTKNMPALQAKPFNVFNFAKLWIKYTVEPPLSRHLLTGHPPLSSQ